MKRPILVTGVHRSGTTWVGKVLAADPRQVGYISEPLNVHHRPGVMAAPVTRWYTCIATHNESCYAPALQDTLAFRYRLGLEMRALRSRKDAARMGRDLWMFLRARLWRARPLLKDPFALFAVPWFARQWDALVVITVRHPAAVVSSLKRLGWAFQIEDLLAQPELMARYLASFRPEMEALLESPQDVIGRGALLWKIACHVIRTYQQESPDWLRVVRHEEASLAPEETFRSLYAFLGLQFTPRVRRFVRESTSAENPTEVSTRNVYAVRLNSRTNLKNWQKRLTPEEIARVREITSPLAQHFYTDDDWT